MPPLRLTTLVQGALPHVSPTSRAVLSTLACRNGHAPPAAEVAAWVGLRDRFQLARVLRADGLPPLEQLTGWIRVLYWVLQAEATGASLLELMQREGLDPATGYRLVRRVTGLRWSEVRRQGTSMVLLKLRDRCTTRVVGARFRIAADAIPMAAAVGDGVVRRADALVRGRATPETVRHPVGVLAGRLPLAGAPFDVVAPAPDTAYVTRTHAAAVERVELRPLRAADSMRVGAVPTRIAVSRTGDCACVTNQFTEDVAVLDLVRRCRAGTIPVAGCPLAATLSADGRTLYVTTNLDRVLAVDLPQGRVTAMVPIPHAGFDLALHPSGRWLYVPTLRAGVILEVDARTLRTTRTFPVGGVAQDIVLSADGLTLYGANQAGWIDAFNLSSGRHAARLALDAGALSLARSPDGAVLYAGLALAGRVIVVDPATLTVRDVLETGGRPRRIAFDPPGHCALIANEAGWMDVVR